MFEINARSRDVLDHGRVELWDHMGGDNSVVKAARVSRSGAAREEWRNIKLLDDMMFLGHTSPFEHVVFTIFVRAPRFVMDEWMRHRTWSYNAESQRYRALADPVGYVPEGDRIGKQPQRGNQQGRAFTAAASDTDYVEGTRDAITSTYAASFASYADMLGEGVPRELSRLVLPMGLYTEFVATVDLWNLLHFFRLRCAAAAQYEIRVYADALKEIVREFAPVTLAAFDRYHLGVKTPYPGGWEPGRRPATSADLAALLASARHALTTYQGLTAFDKLPDDDMPPDAIVLDDKALLSQIDAALGEKG